MTLIPVEAGRVVVRNGKVGKGQACCCNPVPLSATDCTECCPDTVDEIDIDLDVSVDQWEILHSTGARQLTGPLSFQGTVTLEKLSLPPPSPQCFYKFESCGTFGSFGKIVVELTISVTNGQCFFQLGFLGYAAACFRSGGNAVGDLDGCCSEGEGGYLRTVALVGGGPMYDPCVIFGNYVDTNTFIFWDFTVDDSSGSKLLTEDDCECTSYTFANSTRAFFATFYPTITLTFSTN